MRPVQYFSDECIECCKGMGSEKTLEFLESFRRMQDKPMQSKLISLKAPEPMLNTFKQRCDLEGLKYQAKIKSLMLDWI